MTTSKKSTQWPAAAGLRNEMDRLARRLFQDGGPQNQTHGNWTPAVDVATEADNLVVRAELPGVDPRRDLDIRISDGLLEIRGQRRPVDMGSYVRKETLSGSFERRIPIPGGVNPHDVTAVSKQGILEVVIPGAAEGLAEAVVEMDAPAKFRPPLETGQERFDGTAD